MSRIVNAFLSREGTSRLSASMTVAKIGTVWVFERKTVSCDVRENPVPATKVAISKERMRLA